MSSTPSQSLKKYPANCLLVIRSLLEAIEMQRQWYADACAHLMKNEPWDLFFMRYHLPDTSWHSLSEVLDPTLAKDPEERRRHVVAVAFELCGHRQNFRRSVHDAASLLHDRQRCATDPNRSAEAEPPRHRDRRLQPQIAHTTEKSERRPRWMALIDDHRTRRR